MNLVTVKEMYAQYDDTIDELHDKVVIFGMELMPSRVFADYDPVAYRCGFDDYVDSCGYVDHVDSDGDFVGWVQDSDCDQDEIEGEV